jgi:four helix bundle protein
MNSCGPSLAVSTGMAERQPIRERAFQFGLAVVRICPQVRSRGVEWVPVADQLMRAATAVGAMLEEGTAAESRRDMAHKHSMALKELNECAFWLRLMAEAGSSIDSLSVLRQEAHELAAMLTVSVRKLRAPRL